MVEEQEGERLGPRLDVKGGVMDTKTGAIYADGDGALAKLFKKKMEQPKALRKKKKTGFLPTDSEIRIAGLKRSERLVPIARLPRPDCSKCLGTGHIPPQAGAEKYEPCGCVKERPNYR